MTSRRRKLRPSQEDADDGEDDEVGGVGQVGAGAELAQGHEARHSATPW